MNIEKIEINGHYVWVDKSVEIKEGDYFYQLNSNTIIKRHKLSGLLLQPQYFDKKIIAASPELNLEGVPTYVEWLACQEYKSNHPSVDEVSYRLGFNHGYQTRDKELPTWDDVRKAIELARDIDYDGTNDHTYSEEEIIEQLKQDKK